MKRSDRDLGKDEHPDASLARLTDNRALLRRLEALVLYQSLLEVPAIEAWLQLWRQGTATQIDDHGLLRAYGQWFQTMADSGLAWSELLICHILWADNAFTRRAAAQPPIPAPDQPSRGLPPALLVAARQDLATLQLLLPWSGQALSLWIDDRVRLLSPLPAWTVEPDEPGLPEQLSPEQLSPEQLSPEQLHVNPDAKAIAQLTQSSDWSTDITLLLDYYRRRGVGAMGRYQVFRWQDGALQGVARPDPIRLDQLVGYETPKQALLANTERLLSGQPALNVLLYGSRGTGKSSLVKALLNPAKAEAGVEPGPSRVDRGLRLVEVSPTKLHQLPQIVEQLQALPQKFILFVDDLSFEADDEAFKGLKVVLEGGVTARPSNVVVYATSNRRHLIREFFDDRPRPSDAGEIHSWDTVEEKLSFGDRFGLTLTFEPARQERYLAIVHHLAAQAGLAIEPAELDFRAKQWATRHNGPSGRTARQFVDWLQGGSSDDPTVVTGPLG